MAHGSSDDGLCWTNLAKELEGDYDIIMLDARGHGLSDPPSKSDSAEAQAEDLAGLIRELKLEWLILIGHSMGSASVAWFAAKYPDVPRGTIKYLRVLETVPRPWAARRFWDGDSRYQQHAVVSMNTHLHVKRLHGIVPVEPDGSALFLAPPDKNLFFQALDENFMEVQRMRTFINLRPGEKHSCIGCHEQRRWAPPQRSVLALRRPPRNLAPQPGETAPRPIHYSTDVQPILDEHCVRCHNPEKNAAKLDLTGELTTLFSRSYENIISKDLIKVWRENQPKTGDASPILAASD